MQVLARGRRVFPFPHVKVTLVATDETRRNLLAAAFGEDARLEKDIREALEGAGCQIPRSFAVEILTSGTGDQPFFIDYQRQPAKAAPAAQAPIGRLVVVKGKATREEYILDKPRVNIGRMGELTDSEQRVVRRNDVVFEENADEANGTVSRQHAHIRRDAGHYRVADDGSEFGTSIFRDGRSIDVPKGNRRGERLRAGDEIYFGRACLRFET